MVKKKKKNTGAFKPVLQDPNLHLDYDIIQNTLNCLVHIEAS